MWCIDGLTLPDALMWFVVLFVLFAILLYMAYRIRDLEWRVERLERNK